MSFFLAFISDISICLSLFFHPLLKKSAFKVAEWVRVRPCYAP
ncbi:hypothetical protein (plasmid) [Metabacillus dongyingensis]|nr:hypothetical protein [Metabacillus dongyingensis]